MLPTYGNIKIIYKSFKWLKFKRLLTFYHRMSYYLHSSSFLSYIKINLPYITNTNDKKCQNGCSEVWHANGAHKQRRKFLDINCRHKAALTFHSVSRISGDIHVPNDLFGTRLRKQILCHSCLFRSQDKMHTVHAYG